MLRSLGVHVGTRVALVMPQRPEVAVAHISCQQLGAVAMPLSVLFGPEAIEYRLQDSEAEVAIVDASALPAIDAARSTCPALKHVIALDRQRNDLIDWHSALEHASDRFTPVATRPHDPAILIYTSGTTGSPDRKSTRLNSSH